MKVFAGGSCQTKSIFFISLVFSLDTLVFWDFFAIIGLYGAKGRNLRELSCDFGLR